MPKKTSEKLDEFKEKLKYLGLENFDKARNQFENYEPLRFRIPKFYDEKQYRQYRYIPIKDIQILLTPTNRLDDIQQKYKNASPISEYLDTENEENYIKNRWTIQQIKKEIQFMKIFNIIIISLFDRISMNLQTYHLCNFIH